MEKYLKGIIDFLQINKGNECEAEFILMQYDIVDRMKEANLGVETVKPVLEVMELFPLVEFGSPGPLTHFIEQFHKDDSQYYERILLESVLKQPTVHTIWLLNRIINGSCNSVELINVLKEVSEDTTVYNEIREVANDF